MFGIYHRYVKRVVDLLLGMIAAVILALPMLLIALTIKCGDPGASVLFKQTRIGRNGKPFKIYKFRSMRSDAPRHMKSADLTQEDYDRCVTRLGRVLRKYSLDELPQVFNILRGDMSFVGPRPVLANEKVVLDGREKAGLRFFRPGLTGWAQINGRNTLTDEEKVRYDGEYVRRVSLHFDLYCMLRTVLIVIGKKGFLEGSKDRLDRDADFSTGDEFILAECCEELDEEKLEDTALDGFQNESAK
ncbi:MAG: sugar transferase [Oscillospiraceae bacterium]|nr:sugar transferase [Oscillospiraceae bacterium]